jgi:hypothetical protein
MPKGHKHSKETKQKQSIANLGNNNAEIWTLETSKELFEKSIALAKKKNHDFIGEVAIELDEYIEVYDYLADKFPELNKLYNKLKRTCEANCFSNGKNGKIVPSLAIMNLKSNHGWTDRVQTENKTENVVIELTPEERQKRIDELSKKLKK